MASQCVITPGKDSRAHKKRTGSWPPLVQMVIDVLDKETDANLWIRWGVIRDESLDPPYRYVQYIGKEQPLGNWNTQGRAIHGCSACYLIAA